VLSRVVNHILQSLLSVSDQIRTYKIAGPPHDNT
jgi:hypothetical protein